MSEERAQEAPQEGTPATPWRLLVISLVLVIIAGLTPVVWHGFLKPRLQGTQEQAALPPAKKPLTVKNATAVPLSQEQGTSGQRALSEGKKEKPTTPPALLFTSAQDNGRKTLDLYLDYSSQRSRDFLLLNQTTLRELVETGELELRVHPLLSGKPLGIYSFEALSEAASTTPEAAWPLLVALAKEAPALPREEAGPALKLVAREAKKAGAASVTEATITKGSFVGWLSTSAQDPRLGEGLPAPAVFLNDKLLDATKLNLNDGVTLRKEVLQ